MTSSLNLNKGKLNQAAFHTLKTKVTTLKTGYEGLLDQPNAISAGQANEAQSLLAKLIEIHHQLDSNEFNVGVVGPFNSGKSTFLNALLGEKRLSTKNLPETASITAIKELNKEKNPNAKPYAVVHFFSEEEWQRNCENAEILAKAGMHDILEPIQEIKQQVGAKLSQYIKKDGFQQECQIDEISLYTTATKEGNLSPLVKMVEVFLEAELCKNQITLIDTPGLNDPNKLRELVTESFIERIDLLILLFPAEQVFTDSDNKFITEQLLKGRIHKTFFVINKIDNINSDDDDESPEDAVKRIKAWFTMKITDTFKLAQESYPNKIKSIPKNFEIFELSAYQAFLNKVSSNKKPSWSLEQSKLPAFENRLKMFLLEGEKYEALLETTTNRLNQHIDDRLENLNQFILTLDGNVENLKKELAQFEEEKQNIKNEIEKTKEKIDKKINTFNSKDRVIHIKRSMESVKQSLSVHANRELDRYLSNADTGKEAAEGFDDWCKNVLSQQIKDLLDREFLLIIQDFKDELKTDYQALMLDVDDYYKELESSTELQIDHFEINMHTDSDFDYWDVAISLGTSVFLGPVAIAIAGIYALIRWFSGESDEEREKYENQIRQALRQQVLPQFVSAIEKASVSLQREVQNTVSSTVSQIKTIIYPPLKELENARLLKEKQFDEKSKLLQQGQAQRDRKKLELQKEIDIIKGKAI